MIERTYLLLLTIIACCAVSSAASAQTSGGQPLPPTAEQYVEEGDRYAQAKQYDKAVEAYKQALKLRPELAAAHHGLGSAYVNMGRVADALDPLRTAVRLDPENAVAHLNLGITLAALRRGEEALAELNEAKRLSPRHARIHNEIGNALHNSFGRIEEALAAYKEARRLDPNVPAVHHNIGLMLMRVGRFAEAVEPLREALRLNSEYRSARYHLSNAYSRLGRYEEAAESWGKFLELEPRGREALTSRAWNQMYAGGHGEAAAADARKFLDLAGWRDERSQFMILVAHLGHRQAGREMEAREVLEAAAKRCDAGAWPYPIIRYMKGELSAEELLGVAEDNGKKTEVHTYVGMDLLLKGKGEEARKRFEWVREYGNKGYLEYPLAVAELGRAGN